MDDTLDRIENRMGSVEVKLGRVEDRLEQVEQKVDAVDKKVDELSNSTKIEFERVREDIKKLGEGCEQSLDRISREIRQMNSDWSAPP